jgi:hypothetical protein
MSTALLVVGLKPILSNLLKPKAMDSKEREATRAVYKGKDSCTSVYAKNTSKTQRNVYTGTKSIRWHK